MSSISFLLGRCPPSWSKRLDYTEINSTTWVLVCEVSQERHCFLAELWWLRSAAGLGCRWSEPNPWSDGSREGAMHSAAGFGRYVGRLGAEFSPIGRCVREETDKLTT